MTGFNELELFPSRESSNTRLLSHFETDHREIKVIDWVRSIIILNHTPLNGGSVVSIDADGVEEWKTPKRIHATGSYDKRISIKSLGSDGEGNATHLWLSGNPSKFLQGHNVFGSDDLTSLVYDTFCVVSEQFKLNPTDFERQLVKQGHFSVGMVDINYSFELPSRADALSFIRAMEFKAKTRHGRPTNKAGTLYFGKTSERWAIKLYCKAEEIKSKTGQLPEPLTNIGIENWVDNKLRVELRLHKKELEKLDLITGNSFNQAKVNQVFNEYLGRIQMTDQITLRDDEALKLPNKLMSTYTLWREGHDLRNMMSKATYYRQRKLLLEHGINIDLRPAQTTTSNVVPMFKVVEAKPASIPEWAFTKSLIHCSARKVS